MKSPSRLEGRVFMTSATAPRCHASAPVSRLESCSSTRGAASISLRSRCGVHRYYDPSTDQFLSVDPAVMQTGQPYVFTGDDPLNVSDPTGLKGYYCMEGVSEYYSGNYYGDVGAGKCGNGVRTYNCSRTDYRCNNAVSGALAAYLSGMAAYYAQVDAFFAAVSANQAAPEVAVLSKLNGAGASPPPITAGRPEQGGSSSGFFCAAAYTIGAVPVIGTGLSKFLLGFGRDIEPIGGWEVTTGEADVAPTDGASGIMIVLGVATVAVGGVSVWAATRCP